MAVADERGRRIVTVADDGTACEAVLPRLLVEAEEAIVADFLTRRAQPGRLEQLRRALVCRLIWVRNLRHRARGLRRRDEKGSRRTIGQR